MAEIASAFVSILPSARGFGGKLDSQIGGELDKSGKRSGARFGTAMKVGAAGVLAGATALFGFAKTAVGEARDAQKVGALTNAVIKSTGGVANVTAKQVDALATSISLKTGIDDEAIAAGQNMLLTFGQVRNEVGKGNDIFNQATIAANDMAAAFGGDAVSNSKMLGKALNDPTKGVSALTRVGVSFTQQQKDQIKALQLSGNVLGAQKIILGEVTKQTAGAAESQATSSDKFRVAFGNLAETVGTALLPAIDKVTDGLTKFVTGMQTGEGVGGTFATIAGTLGRNLGTIAPVLSAIVAGLVAYRTAMALSAAITAIQAAGTTAATGAQWSLNAALMANPIGLVVVALTALVVGLIIAYKKSETFRKVVDTAFAGIKVIVSAVIGWFAKYVPAVFAFVVGAVKSYIGVYKAVILAAFNIVRGAIAGIGKAWSAAVAAVARFATGTKQFVSKAIGVIKAIPGQIVSALSNVGSLLYNAGRQIIEGLINGIKAMAGAAKDAVTGAIGGAIDAGKGLLGINSPSRVFHEFGLNVGQGFVEGMDATRKPVANAASRMAGGAIDGASGIAVASVSHTSAPIGDVSPSLGGSGGARMTLVVGERQFDAYLREIADDQINNDAAFASTRKGMNR